MTNHPMFLEYDWTFDAYRSHLGSAFPAIETLAAPQISDHRRDVFGGSGADGGI
jgi:hypothetical protein